MRAARGRVLLGGGGPPPPAALEHAPTAAPAPAPAEHEEEEEEEGEQPLCRFCFDGEDDASPGGQLLLNTCACSGSLAAVHARCLLEWEQHAADPGTCGACRAPVRLPPGLAAAVRLQPLWRERLASQLSAARAQPARAAFVCWNWGVVLCGALHAVSHAQAAWLGAPAAACRMAQRAQLERWHLLPSVACAAAYQAVWAPTALGQWQVRWLAGHAVSYAAGLLLEACSQSLSVGAAVGAGCPRGAGSTLTLVLATAATVLQAAGLQHLHPFLHLVRGYQQGVAQAFSWTARLLLLPTGLLGSSTGAAARAIGIAARLLPSLAHGLFRALA